jgi:hypothetical protein
MRARPARLAESRVPKRESSKSRGSSSDASKRNTSQLANEPPLSQPSTDRLSCQSSETERRSAPGGVIDALTSKDRALQRVRDRERARELALSPPLTSETLLAPPPASDTLAPSSRSPLDGQPTHDLQQEMTGTFVSAPPEAAGILSGSWIRDQVRHCKPSDN